MKATFGGYTNWLEMDTWVAAKIGKSLKVGYSGCWHINKNPKQYCERRLGKVKWKIGISSAIW